MSVAPGSQTRIGAIDIGSNALRFIAVELNGSGDYRVVDSSRVPLRLGHDTFIRGSLTDTTVEQALEALRGFKQRLSAHNVAYYRAVATSAVRQSRNAHSFIDLVRKELDLDVEVINGAEEARLAFLAVRRKIPLEEGDWLLIDLGGGSVEVSLINSAGILWTESRSIGSVRLLEQLTGAATDTPARFNRILSEYVSSLHFPATVSRKGLSGVIATGGNIEALAKLAEAPERWRGVAVLNVDELKSVTSRLAAMPFAERVNILGLREDRADVILPAAVVYGRLVEVAGVKELFVPFVGVKEGLVEDMLTKIGSHEATDPSNRQTWDVAVNLGRKYQFEEPHGLQVGRLAVSLFDQLAAGLGLPESDRRFLMVAAILHDVGTVVSYNKHHKHSFYLIAQSELSGFTTREVFVLGLIARYHRKSSPSTKHGAFERLDAEERERVERLAGLLRLADALDRDHFQRVSTVKARLSTDSVVLEVSGTGDLLLEEWALEKKSKLFARVFGRSVEMVHMHSGSGGE